MRSGLFYLRQLSLALFAAVIFTMAGSAQTVRSVKFLSPVLGNSTSGEVSVVNSTGLIYNSGQGAFGGNIGIIDPATNSLIKVIVPADNVAASMFYSRVNQATNIVYFVYSSTPNGKLVVVDGRSSSPTFNQEMAPVVFPAQNLITFAIDQTRHRLYAVTRNNTGTQGQVHIVDVNPASGTFHQILSTVVMPAGQTVGHVAVNTVTNKIYVATSSAGGGVSFFDGTTPALTFIATTQPSGPIAVNEVSNTIYAGRTTANSVQAIDGITNTLTTNIALPGSLTGSLGENLALNSTTERLYAVLSNSSLTVIDTKRTNPTFNTALANIPGIGAGGAVAIDEGLNKIVVASGNLFTSAIIDGTTNAIVASPAGNISALDVTINPITHRAYIGHIFYTTKSIDLTNNSSVDVTTTVEIGEGTVNPSTNGFYLGVTAANSFLAAFDQNDNMTTITGTPHGLGRYLYSARNSVTNRTYMVNSSANVAGTASSPGFVSVVNGATNVIVANVEIGGQPFAIPAINETTNKIYVCNAGLGAPFPSSISVIDGATNAAGFVNTSAFAAGTLFIDRVVANPVSNRIYFKVGQGASVGVIDGTTDVATPLPVVSGFTSSFLVNRTLNRVYFLQSAGLRVLNGTNDTEIINIPLSSPSQFILNEANGRIYVTSAANKTLTTIDGNSNTVITTVPLTKTPGALALNDTSNRLYIAFSDPTNDGNSSISFLDANSLAVERVLRVPLRPSRLIVNSASNVLYASTINSPDRSGFVVVSDRGSAPFDFDGDGRTDISVYRPGSTGTWYIQKSTAGFYGLEFGGGADKITPADYDGDGRTDIAVYRPSEGMWYRFLSGTETFTASPWGVATDITAPADYDGDGRADLAIFRPSDGNWWLNRSMAGTLATQFGQNGDIPVVGDYDGDGTSDIGIFRPSNGLWFIRRSTAGDIGYQFGFGTDKPTPADYDGDGKTDIAVYRPSTGQWFIANSGSATYPVYSFGIATDVPVPGDYDGDGRADIGIFRPSTGQWWLVRSTAGSLVYPFGQNGDIPTPSAFGN